MKRQGFTLIELLVVIMIMVILTGITLGLINVTASEDRVRATAEHVRSRIEGLKHRAINQEKAIGLRILTKEEEIGGETRIIGTGMVYIGSETFSSKDPLQDSDGDEIDTRISLELGEREISFNDQDMKEQWDRWVRRGLLDTGAMINLHRPWYALSVKENASGYEYGLTRNYVGHGSNVNYDLKLNPHVLANYDPIQFERDVVIDMTGSQLPLTWQLKQGHYDLIFSREGSIKSGFNTVGFINLLFTEGVDIYQGRGPGDLSKEGEERILSIRPSTGAADVYRVDLTDANDNGKSDDPYNFALSGQK